MQPEIADIFRLHGEHYRSLYPVTPEQRKAMRDIVLCRTAALGGHLELCDNGCGYARISYNSCRNRHCPKCQSLQQARWLQKRTQRLLPTHYFHMVFTLPHELNPLVLQNRERLYNLLFQAASNTLLALARGYRRLGAQVGFTAVLHTWTQDLLFHPHLHIVVTGGGLHPSGDRWVASKNNFLLPVKALSKIFRAKFLDALQEAFHQRTLTPAGTVEHLNDSKTFRRFIRTLRRKKWVLYSKEPFDGPQQAFAYVSRYTHRVAISNHRLVSSSDGKVTFRARDNTTAGQLRVVTLSAHEFIRRFLLHVLPKGFVRIRHYGLLAPCNTKTKLQTARQLILQITPADGHHQPFLKQDAQSNKPWHQLMKELTGVDLHTCPKCGKGTLLRISLSSLTYLSLLIETPVAILDSS
jgi:hypothetical protein